MGKTTKTKRNNIEISWPKLHLNPNNHRDVLTHPRRITKLPRKGEPNRSRGKTILHTGFI